MNITAKDLYVNYEQFCNINGIKKLDKTTFNEKLKQVGIEYRKTKGNHYFVYSHEELLAIANKNKWIHELDSFDDNSNLELDVDYDSILQEKESEIKMLKAIIEEQKKALEALQIDLVETL
jgi:phage/plasmid-associated DNA primase